MTNVSHIAKGVSSQPPQAQKKPTFFENHGQRRQDDYAWLRDENWQEVLHDPSVLKEEIRAYLEAENAYTKTQLHSTEMLQEELFQEIKGRIKEDESSVPSPDGPWAYAWRYRQGGNYPIFYRIPSQSLSAKDVYASQETILLDGDLEAQGQDFYNLGTVSHSPDHAWLAIGEDLKGSEFYTLRFKNVATGEVLPQTLSNTTGSMVWGKDSQTIFFVEQDEKHRPKRVYRYQVGTDPKSAVLIYEEKDDGFFLSVDETEDRAYVLLCVGNAISSETWVIPADDLTARPKCIALREKDIKYSLSHRKGQFYIQTNAQAIDFKLMKVSAKAALEGAGRKAWEDFIPAEEGRLRLSFTLYEDYLVWMERQDALPALYIYDFKTAQTERLTFEEEAYSLGVSQGYEFKTDIIRYSYQSPTTPSSLYSYDMRTGERHLLKRQEVPSGHQSEDYCTKRISIAAQDGEEIPVTLLWHKETEVGTGTTPLLLYGYGSYGHSLSASFSVSRLSLVDRGFIYAIAHVRGGTEKGYRWYLEGKFDKKDNSFSDFIAVAQGLIAQKWTAKDLIAIQGGSAGGLLVGAVMNKAPSLFRAVVADVPFVDALTTILDADLPLTPPEWEEWGNPIEDPAVYETMLGYSPYDNVRPADYPHVLITGGLTDPRVTYWEPAKWAAKLRDNRTNERLTLLKVNMDSGHAGASGRFDSLKEVALAYAFLVMVFSKASS